MSVLYRPQSASADDQAAIVSFLQQNNLPTEDLGKEHQRFWLIREESQVVSVIGIETYGKYGLLRSMATRQDRRNRGLAGILVDELVKYARQKEMADVFLLTTTAEKFFSGQGFVKVERASAPQEIKGCTEFTHLCPSSATLMKKDGL